MLRALIIRGLHFEVWTLSRITVENLCSYPGGKRRQWTHQSTLLAPANHPAYCPQQPPPPQIIKAVFRGKNLKSCWEERRLSSWTPDHSVDEEIFWAVCLSSVVGHEFWGMMTDRGRVRLLICTANCRDLEKSTFSQLPCPLPSLTQANGWHFYQLALA